MLLFRILLYLYGLTWAVLLSYNPRSPCHLYDIPPLLDDDGRRRSALAHGSCLSGKLAITTASISRDRRPRRLDRHNPRVCRVLALDHTQPTAWQLALCREIALADYPRSIANIRIWTNRRGYPSSFTAAWFGVSDVTQIACRNILPVFLFTSPVERRKRTTAR